MKQGVRPGQLTSVLRAAILIWSTSSCFACQPQTRDNAAKETRLVAGDDAVEVELVGWRDLRKVLGNAAAGISGMYYDQADSILYALSDRESAAGPRLIRVRVSKDFRSLTALEPLRLENSTAPEYDAEALTFRAPYFYVVMDETSGWVERYDKNGTNHGRVPVPGFFSEATANKGLESLSISPSGSYLFAANEASLESAAVTGPVERAKIRILVQESESNRMFICAYQTEPCSEAHGGVSGALALSDDRLLLLERDYQPDFGNTVRLYWVDWRDARGAVASGCTEYEGDGLVSPPSVLKKQLVADFSDLPSTGMTHPGQQPSPLLDNYEALGLGPRLGDGRRIVFVASDDNDRPDQIARILILAVRLPGD